MVFWLAVGLAVTLVAYIRFAPSDPAKWHVAPGVEVDRDLQGGVHRVIETGPDGLARLDAVARMSPRTTVLAGSVSEGMITYITRTKIIGFPDYTTAQQDGDILRINGRLRFGRRDFGVNKTRVDRWIAEMQP